MYEYLPSLPHEIQSTRYACKDGYHKEQELKSRLGEVGRLHDEGEGEEDDTQANADRENDSLRGVEPRLCLNVGVRDSDVLLSGGRDERLEREFEDRRQGLKCVTTGDDISVFYPLNRTDTDVGALGQFLLGESFG